jgi:heat shock protein HspQ
MAAATCGSSRSTSFRSGGLWGDSDEYYRPENSSLVYVLREGRGLPISLACVYMLIGDRIAVDIGGCNFPGHFLARVFHEGQIMLVDCFRGGFFVDEDVLVRQSPGAAGMIRKLIRQDVPAETILDRSLRNLIHAFSKAERAEDVALMRELLAEMPPAPGQLRAQDFSEGSLFARFEPGELVRHQRYGYRGVVVARDDGCQAEDEWYYSNQTQPEREQPWYHVLVDGSSRITYAAESSLEEDPQRTPIAHPLVPVFFGDFDGGRYPRNDQPWPGQS